MDVTTTIEFSSVKWIAWIQSSHVATADGKLLTVEIGPDQEDVFMNLMGEACQQVLRVFSGRQGDVGGVPYEKSETQVTYRFREEEPVLTQAESIKTALAKDVEVALYSFVASNFFALKKNDEMSTYFISKFDNAIINIDNHLYRLHD